jgi:hypothetical protein
MRRKIIGKRRRIVIFYCHALARDGRGAAILRGKIRRDWGGIMAERRGA